MKRLLLAGSFLAMVFSGCVKNEQACSNVSPASEEAQIQAYAAASGITATKHSSGLYYQVVNAGSGVSVSNNSFIRVAYTGKLLNGFIFDQNSNYSNYLNALVEGWKIGIPLIKKGGKIKLIIPSSLGYGCNENGSIPGNSILFFEIELVDVQ